jgi:hypothetical protein
MEVISRIGAMGSRVWENRFARVSTTCLLEMALFTGGSKVYFFERRSTVGDILANGSGCTPFSTRHPHEYRCAPAHTAHDGLAYLLREEEVPRWRR